MKTTLRDPKWAATTIAMLMVVSCSSQDSAKPTATASSSLDSDSHARPDDDDSLLAAQPACHSLTPASVGGPMPVGDVVVLRWLGTSNYELAYHGRVILMDTFYERPPRTRAIGISVGDIQRADAILIGHAHFDHISDVAPVAAQTGATVFGSAITATEAQALGVPASQVTSVVGDNTEHFTFGDIDVQPTHIIHSSIEPTLIPDLAKIWTDDDLNGPLTPAEQATRAAISAKGSHDPNIVPHGTMGFTMTLGDDFRVTWFDSVSATSPEEEQLAQQLGGSVDVGLFPWVPHPIAETQLAATFPHLQRFHPKLYLPTHHDSIWGAWFDSGLEPLFMMARDELPDTSYIAPLYRSPICVRTSGAHRGETYTMN